MEHDGPLVAWMKDNLYVVFLWAFFLVVGPAAGAFFLHDAYGVVMSLIAGLLGGAGCAIIVTVNRILGAY